MNSYINKMVEDLKAQIEDYETIDLVLSELEDMVTSNTSVLHEWTYGKDGEVTAKLVNPRAPKIIEEIIGVIKDFYALTEPEKPAPDTGKHETLIITPKEA
jgi:hypothetical protein